MPAPLTDLALALSRRPVAGLDPLRFLGEAAEVVTRALDVHGCVLVVPATGWVRGSDETATLVGVMQHREGQGPAPTAVRTTRPMLTPDLTRIGLPSLAALASEVGLTSSAAMAVLADGHVVAALQLIGRIGRPVETWHVDVLAPVLDALGARIADLVEIDRMRRAPVPTTALPVSAPPVAAPLLAAPLLAPPPVAPPPVNAVAVTPPPLPARSPLATTPPPLPVPSPLPIPLPVPAQAGPPRMPVVERTEVVRARPARVDRPDPVRADALRVDRTRTALPVRVDVPEFVPVPLADASPELVTEELRQVGAGNVVLLQRRMPMPYLERPRSRHRREG